MPRIVEQVCASDAVVRPTEHDTNIIFYILGTYGEVVFLITFGRMAYVLFMTLQVNTLNIMRFDVFTAISMMVLLWVLEPLWFRRSMPTFGGPTKLDGAKTRNNIHL